MQAGFPSFPNYISPASPKTFTYSQPHRNHIHVILVHMKAIIVQCSFTSKGEKKVCLNIHHKGHGKASPTPAIGNHLGHNGRHSNNSRIISSHHLSTNVRP